MNLKPLLNFWFGDKKTLEHAIAALITGGHILIEGPPGVGKTQLFSILAKAFSLKTNRIQGTPDLMPSDVIGTDILEKDGHKLFHKGPIFCELLQIDEINRIAPKTLSAILQAMQEKKVSISHQEIKLAENFHIIATRNTREIEGVYPIPEAALDRFIISLRISLPSSDNETKLLKTQHQIPFPEGLLGQLSEHKHDYQHVSVSERIMQRAIKVVRLSRDDEYLYFGAGVRGSQALIKMAQALAWVREESNVTINILEEVCLPVLSHRLNPQFKTFSTKPFVDKYWEQTDMTQQLLNRFGAFIK